MTYDLRYDFARVGESGTPAKCYVCPTLRLGSIVGGELSDGRPGAFIGCETFPGCRALASYLSRKIHSKSRKAVQCIALHRVFFSLDPSKWISPGSSLNCFTQINDKLLHHRKLDTVVF